MKRISDTIAFCDALTERLEEYAVLFSENFPVLSMRGLPDTDIIKIIDRCISERRRYSYCNDERNEY